MPRIEFSFLVLLGAIAATMSVADRSLAVDHNNLDANRPLDFDDADSIGFREQALDLGAALTIPEGESVGGEFEIEYLYGFAPNTHLNIGIDPSIEEDSDETEFSIGDLSVGVLHNFNREYNNTPAFALRGDAAFPTGNDSEGVDFRLRGIASKTVGQYNRLHLNLDANLATATEDGDRSFVPGVILGYSRPIGYSTNFTRTFLAQAGVRGSEAEDDGAVVTLGVGLRQQIGYQSVLDFGILGDIAGEEGETNELRLVAGYSFAF
ncbi:transporter [Myxosarcina sp. GI1]|uniref:transporter n=1 Tax=Myxosarcina sp. GI1 TaxID=1541065 RepID=UPI0005641CE1|nr:transporter [Myxosarcina sp. GI1]